MTEFAISNARILKLSEDMVSEMKKGLHCQSSSLLMIPTYIHRLPTGNESGKFLALDFGGSTFRVILVEIKQHKSPSVKSVTVSMENSMKSVSGDELFNHLASQVASFMTQENMIGQECLLGFTFSFPMNQSSLSSGTLVYWTKGFGNSGVVGEDVAVLLNKALSKNEVTKNVRVVALANDTAGTLVSGSCSNKDCKAGLIIGTGTNAAYCEKVSNVSKLSNISDEMVVINMEWGNFGELGHLADLQTEFDKTLDASSNNSGKQLFEKMISGLYMGELARLALIKRVKDNHIFKGVVPPTLQLANSLDGAVVSDFISNGDNVLKLFPGAGEEDIKCIRGVCNAVSDRAARLAAGGIHAIWTKIGSGGFTVAVDGSVFVKHATFSTTMLQTLTELGCDVKFDIATDGSGLGSALIAAVA